jgi:Cd(II)/Pb(II)-responsive transcriptional regulator
MQIGELARLGHCKVETVRYYESAGLLAKPQRSAGNFRVYGAQHLERLRFIRNCRALDMSHDEIKALIGLVGAAGLGCGEVNTVFDKHIAHVTERINELRQLQQQLETLRQQCDTERSVQDCGILAGLSTMATQDRQERHTHLG